jgi:hypothetical protein
MKKTILAALAILLLLPLVASTQNAPYQVKYATLLQNYDLDGEAADAIQVVSANVMVDNGTSVGGVNYTIVAQPDVCRLLNLTIVDTNLTAGTLTVTGFGCMDETKSCSFAFTAGDDTGIKTLTCADGKGAYLKTVSTVTTNTMTGESDETFSLGYAGINSVNGWASYGIKTPVTPNSMYGVDPFGSTPILLPMTTSGLPSTTITGVATNNPFTNIAVGDLLLFNLQGMPYERKVTARASANSITVNSQITIPTSGTTFSYKHLYFSTNPADMIAVPVEGWSTAIFTWSVAANANTGGVISLLQCTPSRHPDFTNSPWVQVNTTTVASAATLASTTESISLTLLPYAFCRMGFRFGTGDDADVADENISLNVVLMK